MVSDKGGDVGKKCPSGLPAAYVGDEMRIGVHSGAFLAPQSDVVRGPYTLYTELQNAFHSIVSCYIVLANLFNSTVIT